MGLAELRSTQQKQWKQQDCSPCSSLEHCACPRHSLNFVGEGLCRTTLHLAGSLREEMQDELRLKSLHFSSVPAPVGTLGLG